MSLLNNVTVTLEGYDIWCTPVSPAHTSVLQTHTQHTRIRERHNHYIPTTVITAIIIITTTIIIIISTVASCTVCTEGGHNYSVLRHQICCWCYTYPVNGTLSFNAKTNHLCHHPYHCHTMYTLDGTLSFNLSRCRQRYHHQCTPWMEHCHSTYHAADSVIIINVHLGWNTVIQLITLQIALSSSLYSLDGTLSFNLSRCR